MVRLRHLGIRSFLERLWWSGARTIWQLTWARWLLSTWLGWWSRYSSGERRHRMNLQVRYLDGIALVPGSCIDRVVRMHQWSKRRHNWLLLPTIEHSGVLLRRIRALGAWYWSVDEARGDSIMIRFFSFACLADNIPLLHAYTPEVHESMIERDVCLTLRGGLLKCWVVERGARGLSGRLVFHPSNCEEANRLKEMNFSE